MTSQVEDLYLQPWQEALGTCLEVAVAETEAVVVLETENSRYRLRLLGIKSLPKTLQGQTIAVLRTDSLESPFVLRKVAEAEKIASGRQCRRSRLPHCEGK